jgi:hypothetical protein
MLKSPVMHEDLPSLGGIQQIETIYDLIKNEIVYKKRIAYLKKKREELVDLISTVGSVNAIHEIREQAKIEKIKITEELNALRDKKEKADVVIAEAHTRARSIEADAASRARDQQTTLDYREKELTENRKQFGERERMLRLAEVKVGESQTAVNSELKRVKQLQEAANKARMDFETRRQKVEKFMAGV